MHSQERIMAPHTAKLVITHHPITRHPQRVRDLTLLLDREKDVALHAEHKYWRVAQGPQALREVWQMRGRV